MSFSNQINKYFKKNSDLLSYFNDYTAQRKHYNYFIIIPVFNEYDYILDTLESINKNSTTDFKNLLVILVINNSVTDSKKIVNNNFKTHQLINQQEYKYEKLVIDFYSKGKQLIDKHAGVGTARKIGMDYALKLSNPQSIFFSLDADTIISKQYLKIIKKKFKESKMHACVINFKHQKSSDSIIEQGIRLYENKIKNIAKQINNTGSPYGYVSMGSAIVCTALAYVSVGGMPKKKATEDFYFLQALAKFSKIYRIKEILVFPSSRCEQRVYLGTGYRLNEFKKNITFRDLDYSFFAYQNLRYLITTTEQMWGQDYNLVYNKIKTESNKKIVDFLVQHNFKNIWINFCKETKNKKQFMLFFNQWFDALKTIKFLKKLS